MIDDVYLEIFKDFSLWSLVDILIISAVFYKILKLLSGTKSAQVFFGVCVVLAIGGVSKLLPLTTFHWLVSKLYPSIFLVVIVIFQDEIRRFLMSVGRRPLQSNYTVGGPSAVDQISAACFQLASQKLGALIVIERSIFLQRYASTGTELDARISSSLILSIFDHTSPLHDGAIFIQRDRISFAGCFLPLNRESTLDPMFGTRHRAAMRISQDTDALVLVVSEERGKVSLVDGGTFLQVDSEVDLKSLLQSKLVKIDTSPQSRFSQLSKRFSELVFRKSSSERSNTDA